MVALVLVSHSRPLADALVRLVNQVAVEKTPAIAIAAGIGEDRQEFGTDAAEILEAIQTVYSPDGVAILMDLGSAVLSAEMAVDMLPEEMRQAVRFCAAPFVEGAIVAGVQASLGNDLATVCREAEQALQRKAEQINPNPVNNDGEKEGEAPVPAPAGQTETVLTLKNQMGLHARPAARFVQRASSFDAEIRVRNLTTGKGPVSARSLIAIISLGAVQGNQIGIQASGPQAEKAVEELTRLVEVDLQDNQS